MKIKEKKLMNLLELIKWGWENDIRNQYFSDSPFSKVGFDADGDFTVITDDDFLQIYVHKNELFRVEKEIEVTEDTVLNKFIAIRLTNGKEYMDIHTNTSISKELQYYNENFDDFKILKFQCIHSDMTKTTIWENGKMVENSEPKGGKVNDRE